MHPLYMYIHHIYTSKHPKYTTTRQVLTFNEQFPEIPVGCVQSGSAPIGLIEALDGNDDRRITVEGKINRLID